MFVFACFFMPIGIVFGVISGVLASIFFVVTYVPAFLIFLFTVIAEVTQKKITITNKRILKQTGPGRFISIWFKHVRRFDKVAFPDGTGILYYTVPKTIFGKQITNRYKIENITHVNEAFSIVTQDNTV